MEDDANTNTRIENADAFARSRLSEKRYGHTLRVADTAADLARVHGLDEDRARPAALLHDAARETGPEEFLRLAGEWELSVGEPERQSPKLLHGPVAAELARRELGVEDEEVLEAVRAHTTGKARDGTARARAVRGGQDRTGPRLPERGAPAQTGQGRSHAAATESLRRAIAHNEGRARTPSASHETLEWLEADHTPQGRVEQ